MMMIVEGWVEPVTGCYCAALKLFTYGCALELALGWEISIVTRPTLPTSRQSMAPDKRK